jgi:hypothetical protein
MKRMATKKIESPENPAAALNRQNLNLYKLACKDESRFTLAGVYVTPTCTVETDGHQLVKVTNPQIDMGHVPLMAGMDVMANNFKPFILPSSVAADAMKQIPKSKSLDPILSNVFLGQKGTSVQVGTTDLLNPRVITAQPVAGNFPDYERVIPDHLEGDFSCVFDAVLMERIFGAIGDFFKNRVNQTPCRLTFRWPKRDKEGRRLDQAVRIDAINEDTGQELTAVVMAMKDEAFTQVASRAKPDWYEQPCKTPMPSARGQARIAAHKADVARIEAPVVTQPIYTGKNFWGWLRIDEGRVRVSETELRAAAREHYAAGDPIKPKWHWVIKDECTRINAEADRKVRANRMLQASSAGKPEDWNSMSAGQKAAWTRRANAGLAQPSGGTSAAPKVVTERDPNEVAARPANWDTCSAGVKAAWTRQFRMGRAA